MVGSSILRLTDAGVYTHIGPEIGVAQLKLFYYSGSGTYSNEALKLQIKKGSITTSNYHNMITELELISQQISQVLRV